MRSILSRSDRLEGPAVIWSWTRPRKLAYFLSEDNADSAFYAISMACVSWGGASFLFVPTRDGLVSEEWINVILRYDPDLFVDTTGEVATLPARLRAFDIPVRKEFAGERPKNVAGALLYAVLAAHLPEKPKEGLHALIPTWNEDSDLALPFAAKWGVLREDHLAEALRGQGLLPSVRLADVVRLTTARLPDSIDALANAQPPGARAYPEDTKLLSLPELTLVGVPEWYSPRPAFLPNDAADELMNRQHSRRIVITGDPSSVSDLCLYWSLRASRPGKRDPFPLWIPLPRLAAADTELTIRGLFQDASSRLDRSDLYFLSTSATQPEISAVVGNFRGICQVMTDGFADFFPAPVQIGDRRTEIVTFTQGRAHIPRSSDPKLEAFGSGESIAQEIEISGFRLPQTPSLSRHIYGNAWRITRTGLQNMYYPAAGEQPARITLPDSWRILEAIFQDAGYLCSPSDKGRFAVGVVELIGGVEGLGVFASSLVHGLIGSMSERQGRREIQRAVDRVTESMGADLVGDFRQIVAELAPNQELRRTFGFSQFVEALNGQDSAKRVVNWLLSRSLIHRGTELTCSECGLRRWYGLDRVGSSFVCDGCLRSAPAPLDSLRTEWQYRLNELAAKTFDQGTLAHLLLAHIRLMDGALGRDTLLGMYPGIFYWPVDTPDDRREIDYVEIRNGALMIGECKTGEFRGGRQQMEVLGTLAERVGASEVALLSSGAAVADEFRDAVAANFSGEVTCYGPTDIFDCHPGYAPREEPGDYLSALPLEASS